MLSVVRCLVCGVCCLLVVVCRCVEFVVCVVCWLPWLVVCGLLFAVCDLLCVMLLVVS